MRTGDTDRSATDNVRPVVILDSDREAALVRQRELGNYEIAWIAIFHDVAQARHFLASGSAAAVLLTARGEMGEILDLARSLGPRGIPCLLLAPPKHLEWLARQPDLPECIALDCDREAFSHALARLGLRHVGPPS